MYEDNETKNLSLTDTKSISTSKIDDKFIENYYYKSKISSSTEEELRDGRYVVKNNNVNLIDENFKIKRDSILIDYYNNLEIETVLTTNGTIKNLRDKIKIPVDFDNNDIKNITSNTTNTSNIVLVEYENKRIYGFNYLTEKNLRHKTR